MEIKGEPPVLISRVILGPPLRDYFIKRVKGPLMKVLILVGKRMPGITKENTEWEGTHTLIDIFEKLFKYTHVREKMFRSAKKIFLAEVDHDLFYRDFFLLFIEEVIKAILADKLHGRRDEEPSSYYWTNVTPKGGKYSIINILQDKKAMENLLGDKWIYKEAL